ncbi:ephrin-B2a [Denticeps clupeoides]|uniref:Ephrin RBD domain-containing protein n=1 Tax=Denticeps clupeoides TaxID=299321 RepID=A0AAY4ARC3_9TELE|nr:ephrin-B2a-like [Denticeps clupeoides]
MEARARRRWNSGIWEFLGIALLACGVNPSRAVILDSIYWNTTNSKFVPGQGLVLYPQIGDKMDIVCPRLEGGATEGVEFYKIYMVPRDQLESCTITKADTPLLNCIKPDQDVKFTLKFQEFSPNLWGLEFFRGKDYYIISTSDGTLEGLDNQDGGVCKSKSMKIIMKVGQNPSDPAAPKDNPTRHPPRHPALGKDTKSNEVLDKLGTDRIAEEETGGNKKASSMIGSEVAVFVGIASGSIIFIIIIVMLVLLLLKYRRRHRKHSPQHAATLSLSTLATPKRGGGGGAGGNNNGSEPSDIIIPLRTADSVFCPHYEKVSGDYGHPVYIVQEMPPQSPANIYYKV